MIFPQRLKEASDFDEALAFFEGHLRANSPCRLVDEYPLIFRPEHLDRILVKRMNGEIVAGLGMLPRQIEIEGGVIAKALFVGSVVTDPRARLQGYQRELFHAIEEVAEREDVDLLMLWSSQIDFYHKLGFFLGGLQATWSNHMGQVRLGAKSPQPAKMAPENFELSAKHFRAFESRPMCVKRTFDEFRLLSRIPQMRIAVTENAYAILGKGEDFRNVIHEWAGPASEVLACFDLLRDSDASAKILSPGVLHTDDDREVVAALEAASFEARLEYLGLFKLIGSRLRAKDFDPSSLKYPFFIWGLDSV